MKKIALVIAVVLVLIGSVVGGVVAANGATPTLTLTGGSSAPSRVTISGKMWTPAVQVDLYMDMPLDEAHRVAFAMPDSRGSFLTSFALGPTNIGVHKIIGQQNGGTPVEVEKTFSVTRTQQLDDRVQATSGSTQGGDEPIFEYGQIRHVSLTLNAVEGYVNSSFGEEDSPDGGDITTGGCNHRYSKVTVLIDTELGEATLDCFGDSWLGWLGHEGLHTYQFDTPEWRIIVEQGCEHKGAVTCAWAVVTTNPGTSGIIFPDLPE